VLFLKIEKEAHDTGTAALVTFEHFVDRDQHVAKFVLVGSFAIINQFIKIV
jgi:hypothetical protein